MVTSASKIKSQQQRRSVVEISQDQKSESRNQKSLVGAILLIGFLGLIWIGLNESGFLGSRALVTAAPSPDVIRKKDAEELQKIVDFHRNETGRKLNRERINIEFENQRTAPPIPAGAKIIPEADVMRGVPITSEPFHRQSSRDRTSSETRDFTDTRTQMSLQEEQAAQEAARLQRKQYIDQFIANAAKAGYKVRVEPNGQVKVLGQIPVKDSSFNGTAIPAENRNPAMDGVALPQ